MMRITTLPGITRLAGPGGVISIRLNATMRMKTDSKEAMPFGMGTLLSMEEMTQESPRIVKYNVDRVRLPIEVLLLGE
jgi:hypothetical protein